MKVAIVDDHTMMREGLSFLVESMDEYKVCWSAGDAAEALLKIGECRPDVLLTDMTLPGRNGLELIKDTLALDKTIPILVISMHDESLYAQRVLKAGAKGYIMKDAPSDLLIEAVQTVSMGRMWVSQKMSSKILQLFSGQNSGESVEGVHRLSDREFEIFQLIGEGRSKQHISDSLNISPKTIDVHKAHIRQKLELEDATAVLRYAVRWVELRKLASRDI